MTRGYRRPRPPGRPKRDRGRAAELFTRRFRALVELVHAANLAEASRATGIPYPTLRDLYTGRTVNPAVRTVEVLEDCYGVGFEWFRSAEEPEQVPVQGIVGFVPPHPSSSGRPQLRRVLLPFEAWPLYGVYRTLARQIERREAGAGRPIVGEATGDAFAFRLTTFLLQPLLAAERAGGAQIPDAEAPVTPTWVARLRALGKLWQSALAPLLDE